MTSTPSAAGRERPPDPAAPAGTPMDPDLVRLADETKGFLPPDEGLALYDAAWAALPRGPLLEVGTYCGKSDASTSARPRWPGWHSS